MSAISQLRLKVSVDGAETRRFALEAPVNYPRLRQLIENLLHAQGFTIQYTDDEGERVTIASDADLREAMTLMEEMQQKALKLTVSTAVQAPVQKEVPHVVKEPVLAAPAAEAKVAPAGDNAEQDKAKFDEALANIVNEFSRLEPLSIQDEILSLVVLFQQFSQRIEAGEQVHWDTLVGQVTANAPVISSLPCFHEDHQKFLDALETITKFFVERVESGLLYPIPPHLAPLMFMKSEKVLKGFAQIQGAPLQLQVVLENLASFVGKLEAVHAQPEADEKVDSTVHTGVQCDNCKVVPIVGNRYKCTACHNFDLCEACESSGVHPADHELIKFKVAVVRGPRFGGPFGHCHGGRGRRWRNSQCPWSKGREQLKRESSPVPVAQPLREGMGSEFLRDVNVEDKTRLGKGQMHVKTWSVRNDGQVDWDNTVKLVYASGNREILLDEQEQFDVPLLKSGETGDINVPFIVPEQAGNYKTVFRFVKNGEQFGHHLWVEFISE